MKNYFWIFMFAILANSCGSSTDNDIEGKWIFEYEKVQTSSTIPSLNDLPFSGTVTFESENKGEFASNRIAYNYKFDWEFGKGKTEISFINPRWANPEEGTQTYEFSQVSTDKIILRKETSFFGLVNEEVLTLTKVW